MAYIPIPGIGQSPEATAAPKGYIKVSGLPDAAPPTAAPAPPKDVFTGKPLQFGDFGGSSSQSDPFSGRPFLTVDRTIPKTFMSEETKVTSIDKTRTAPLLDPTKAQKFDPGVLQNPRMKQSVSDALRKELGATAFQELDHIMPLSLGGSNDPLNVRPETAANKNKPYAPGSNPTPTDPLETALFNRVQKGEIPLAEAWRQIAKVKGIKLMGPNDLKPGKVDDWLLNHPSILKPLAQAQALLTGKPIPQTVDERQNPAPPVITSIFPSTLHVLSELQLDPFTLRGDNPRMSPAKYVDKYLETVFTQGDEAAKAVADVFAPKKTFGERVGAFLSAGARTGGAALSPITAVFSASEQVPVIGSVAKLIAAPFALVGDAGFDASKAIGATLLRNVPQPARDRIVEGMGEIFALAGQIYLGGKAEGIAKDFRDASAYRGILKESGLKDGAQLEQKYGLNDPKQYGKLEAKYGAKDATTILDKAKTIADQAREADVRPPAPAGYISTDEAAANAKATAERVSSAALADWEKNIAPDLKAGKATVVSPDNIKDIMKDYDPANHPVYSAASKENLARLLKESPAEKVVFTAGGPGSGKSEVVVSRLKNEQAIIVDGTLKSLDSAMEKIKMVEQAGKKVEIHAVLKNPGDARRFTMIREAKTGRPVPQDLFVDAHSTYNETLQKLAEDGYDIRLTDARNIHNIKDIVNLPEVPQDKVLATLKDAWYSKDEVLARTQKAELAYKNEQRSTTKEGVPVQERGGRDGDVRSSRGGGADNAERAARGSAKGGGANDKGPGSQREPVKLTDKGKLESRVYARLKAEHPELLDQDVTYKKRNIQAEIRKAVDLVAKDKQKAYRIAIGAEESPTVLSNAVNIALREKALQEGNVTLYNQLVKAGSLELTRKGQEIVSEKAAVGDNSTSRYVRQLLSDRMAKLGDRYLDDVKRTLKIKKDTPASKALEVIDREVAKAQKSIESSKMLDLNAAQKLIESLACK